MNALEARPRRREGVVAQKAGDSLVLLDVDSGLYFSLDGIGDRIWSLSDGRSAAAIVDEICAEYEADRTTVETDVLELLQELESEGLIACE